MSQTAAIFHDAYRELNARKLFWITLILSGVVVGAFALIGINEQGLRIIAWDLPAPINTQFMSESAFYKLMFVNLGVGFWLSWLAAILALVSTASIFPDFVSTGAIDMVLSKPIGRWRLFLTKYATGLLFVALQVAVFSAAAFLVLGFRGGTWEPSVFLAIPLVVLFFSYLFCVCALLGIVTRSTIAALLLTLLFWFVIYGVHTTESTLLLFKFQSEQQVKSINQTLEHESQILSQLKSAEELNQQSIDRFESSVASSQEKLQSAEKTLNQLSVAHRITMGIKTLLPKTTETIGLVDRKLVNMDEIRHMTDETPQSDMERAQMEFVEEVRDRSPWWIIGTSLLFEVFVLVLAGWIFSRRDF
ncbi:MAG TPA: ABC transporter permease [Phycisphaerales bacterium]|nr:ABC transporter permease [Phycisphaerales bacterium]HRQ76280.1 ABC transporter permease [Phycisphaerales bacterium]